MPLSSAQQEGKRVLLTTKIDRFIASFSGGKDSQVVLDLCTRAIPPTEFEVIYSDTGYELPPSLALYEEVKAHYQKTFPALKFLTARNHESVLNYWDKIGTPSDSHRWCCSVMKTAPLYRMLKVEGNKQARVLTFDGVRAEESTRRSAYNRIGKGVKHGTVINASPILLWSSVEIFLYLFRNNLHINKAYRFGLTRVGCIICPFSSEWNDMLINRLYTTELQPFLSRIEKIVKKAGIQDYSTYIATGKWKRRAGGRDLHSISAFDILKTKPNFEILLKKPQKDPQTWLNTVGSFVGNSHQGIMNYANTYYPYTITEQKPQEYRVTIENCGQNILLQGLLKRVFNKTTFCINCEACEVECPTGALSILPEISIDKDKCVHCGKCLNFHETGCIVAHSLKITETTNKMKLISYNNFGLREEWLDYYMSNHSDYFSNTEHGLNIKEQLPSFVKWLTQAEILQDAKTRELSSLGKVLVGIYQNNPNLVWQIIWVNLVYNSPIVQWFAQNTEFGSIFTDAILKEGVQNDYPNESVTTIKNIVYAMCRTFKESPIGEGLKQFVKIDKTRFTRTGTSDIELEAIAYSIYLYAKEQKRNIIKVSDFYRPNEKIGLYREFGIERKDLEKKLRAISSMSNKVLDADLNMGLEHITIREDLSPEEVLAIMTE